jgi:hypothetical protein
MERTGIEPVTSGLQTRPNVASGRVCGLFKPVSGAPMGRERT